MIRRLWRWTADHATRRRRAAAAQYKADPLGRGLDEIEAETTTQETWLGDLARQMDAPGDLEPPPTLVDFEALQPIEWTHAPTEEIDVTPFVISAVALPSGPPLPAGALTNRQRTYDGGRRCLNPACGTPTTGDVCVTCTVAGYVAPPKVADRTFPLDPGAADFWNFNADDVIAPNFTWDDAAIARLITGVFACETCGAPLDSSGLCSDYGRFHATAEHLAALDAVHRHPSLYDGDDAA